MNSQPTYKPLVKLLATLLALTILCVQFTEVFHHHAASSADHHQSVETIRKVQLKADCAICHFLSHQQFAIPLRYQLLTFVLVALVCSMLVRVIIRIDVGYRYEIAGRGPPASQPSLV